MTRGPAPLVRETGPVAWYWCVVLLSGAVSGSRGAQPLDVDLLGLVVRGQVDDLADTRRPRVGVLELGLALLLVHRERLRADDVGEILVLHGVQRGLRGALLG